MHIDILGGLVGLALAGASLAAPRPQVYTTPGCQGEGCFGSGQWLVERDIRLYKRPGSVTPIATLQKGNRVSALRTLILTNRIGHAVLTKDIEVYEGGKLVMRLSRGAHIRPIYYEGEEYSAALAPDGRKISVMDGEYRVIRRMQATDWTEVRLIEGVTGWIKRDPERLACTGHGDASPECRKLNPDYWGK